MPAPAIPLVITGTAWAARSFQAYRAARAAKLARDAIRAAQVAEALEAAQQQAEQQAKEKEQTDAQAKSDAVASSNCANCKEDPDCETARQKLKDALYGIKGDGSNMNRGLAERLCHWLHGTSDVERASHMTAVSDGLNRVNNAKKWLAGEKPRPPAKKDPKYQRLSKKEKEKLLENCQTPPDLQQDFDDLAKFADEVVNNKSNIKPFPRADFSRACSENAFNLIKKAIGK